MAQILPIRFQEHLQVRGCMNGKMFGKVCLLDTIIT